MGTFKFIESGIKGIQEIMKISGEGKKILKRKTPEKYYN